MNRVLKAYDINYISSKRQMMNLIQGLLTYNGQLLDSFRLPSSSYPKATYCVRIKIGAEERDKLLFEAVTGLELIEPLVPSLGSIHEEEDGHATLLGE